MNITKITIKEANTIVNTRTPLGKFYAKDLNGVYVGIDNATGEAWTEDFTSFYDCLMWLSGLETDSKEELDFNVEEEAQVMRKNTLTLIEVQHMEGYGFHSRDMKEIQDQILLASLDCNNIDFYNLATMQIGDYVGNLIMQSYEGQIDMGFTIDGADVESDIFGVDVDMNYLLNLEKKMFQTFLEVADELEIDLLNSSEYNIALEEAREHDLYSYTCQPLDSVKNELVKMALDSEYDIILDDIACIEFGNISIELIHREKECCLEYIIHCQNEHGWYIHGATELNPIVSHLQDTETLEKIMFEELMRIAERDNLKWSKPNNNY